MLRRRDPAGILLHDLDVLHQEGRVMSVFLGGVDTGAYVSD
jgi:hypothetical protein